MNSQSVAHSCAAIASKLSPVGAQLYRLIGQDMLDAERARNRRLAAERRQAAAKRRPSSSSARRTRRA